MNIQINNDGNVLETFHEEINIVKNHDRSLAIITSGFIELLINNIIDEKCKVKSKNINNLSIKFILLNELGIIDDKLYDILKDFNKIRNKAAHKAQFNIDKDTQQRFNNGLKRFGLPDRYGENDFCIFCKQLLGTLWNANLDEVKDIII